MYIAICDDEEKEINTISALVKKYSDAKSREMECDKFLNGDELVREIIQGKRYDIIFLDIFMPKFLGIDVAKKIRETDSNVKIIFSTTTPDFAVQSYAVKAFYYMLKPLHESTFFSIMDEVCLSINDQNKNNKIVVKVKNGIKVIYISRLEYCEIYGRTILYHLTDGTVYEAFGKMLDLEETLSQYSNFSRIHRSYIANQDLILSIGKSCIVMESGQELPVSREKLSDIKEAFIARMTDHEA